MTGYTRESLKQMNAVRSKKSTKPKKRTRRAVNARRTLEEREQAADKLLDEWLGKMDKAMGKVKHYQKELKKVRKLQAKVVADTIFGSAK